MTWTPQLMDNTSSEFIYQQAAFCADVSFSRSIFIHFQISNLFKD